VAHRGLSEKFIEEVMGFSSSAIQAQIVRDAPYFGPYPPHSDVINQTRKDEGLVDFACLPLTYGNVIIGALNLGSHYPVSIDPKNKAAIVTAASHLGEVLGRIETMRELHEQRLQFYALTMASDEAVAIFNEGRVIRANRAFCEMLGMEEEKVIGLKKPDIVHPEDLDIYFKHKEAGLLSTTTSLRIKTLDGNYKSIMVKFKDLKKLNGYEDCVVLLAHEWQPRKH
jgi:PAS domain S-box-containing protein